MAKGFKINGTDFDDLFEPARSGFSSVTFTGLTPACTYMARTGNASNPNAGGYWKYNGVAYDAHHKGYKVPKSLTIGGSWSNIQYTSEAPDTTGLSFTATYQDGSTSSVSVSVSPTTWSSTVGTQTATFSYSYNGVSVSATKSASVVRKPNSLGIIGSWSNTQYTGRAVDYTGLSFWCFYSDGVSAAVTPSSYSPTTWSSTVGTQTCTFYYTENGVTVSTSKSANVIEPWQAESITLTNPNSALVFRSISGNLYTNSTCTTKAATNTKYTETTFYYKSNETKPTGSYIYDYGDGPTSSSEPSQDDVTAYYKEGSLTACLGTSGYCWTSTSLSRNYVYIILSNGDFGFTRVTYNSYHRVRPSTF